MSKVFESTLNNLKLFFSMPSTWNSIVSSFILKEKQVLEWADCFMSCAVPVENLRYIAIVKKWLKEEEKKQLSA